MVCCVVRGSVRVWNVTCEKYARGFSACLGVSCFVCGIIGVSVSSERKKSKMFGYSFLNYNCLLHRLAKGAKPCDFVLCFLSAGEFYACPLDAVVFPVHGVPVVFLGYSRRGTL